MLSNICTTVKCDVLLTVPFSFRFSVIIFATLMFLYITAEFFLKNKTSTTDW